MRLADFEAMVRRLCSEVPCHFFEGIAEVVSPRTVPHPDREEIFTLGECDPLPWSGQRRRGLQSRIVLYHGSFAALSRLQEGFDWRREAWRRSRTSCGITWSGGPELPTWKTSTGR